MSLDSPPFSPTHQITYRVEGRIGHIPVVLLGNALYTEEGWERRQPSEFTLSEGKQLLCHGKQETGFSLEELEYPTGLWEVMGTLPGLG